MMAKIAPIICPQADTNPDTWPGRQQNRLHYGATQDTKRAGLNGLTPDNGSTPDTPPGVAKHPLPKSVALATERTHGWEPAAG